MSNWRKITAAILLIGGVAYSSLMRIMSRPSSSLHERHEQMLDLIFSDAVGMGCVCAAVVIFVVGLHQASNTKYGGAENGDK